MNSPSHEHGNAAGVAAFFDVDNTIVRGASAFHIARGMQKRGFFTWRDIFRFAWQQLKYQVFGESKDQIERVRAHALSIIKGLSVAEVASIGEQVYDEVLAMRVFPGTKALLDAHLADGHEVWLVTASPVEVGRLIARRLGATGCLGTEAEHIDGFYTGALIGDMMHGKAKADGVQKLAAERNLDLAASYAYGDSMNDVSMLEAVGNPCAINPDRRLKRYAAKQGWERKEFRGRNKNGRKSIVRASGAGLVWVILTVLRGIKHALLKPFRRDRGSK